MAKPGLPRPSSRPSSAAPAAAPAAAKTPYPICGTVGYYQRADVKGRVKKPKLDADLRKLKDLFAYCQDGNFREVRAVVVHYPYLLSLTDAFGFSALHYAAMSSNPAFISQLLQLYRDPATFSRKLVTYDTEEDLEADVALGFEVRVIGKDGEVKVTCEGATTKAQQAGVIRDDQLESCSGPGFLSYRQPPPLGAVDVLAALKSGNSSSFGFPVTLEFRGNAALEILGRDGWTPCHGAAGKGGPADRQVLMQLLNEEEQALLARDVSGCTPGHWVHIELRSRAHAFRRPLSAGPRGHGPNRWASREAPKQQLNYAAATGQTMVPPPSSAMRAGSAIAVGPCLSRPMTPSEPRSQGLGPTAMDLAEVMARPDKATGIGMAF